MLVPAQPASNEALRVAGLFAGIGGIELGLHKAGHTTSLLCEIDPAAVNVLESRFGMQVERDVRELEDLPEVDLVAAGFPCQDLSQAGRTRGIGGEQSSLVDHVFRLLEGARRKPRWLLLENVPFMLQLGRGEAMRYLTRRLAELDFQWAYRVVDTRSFGLPQRRLRVILVASKSEDPRRVLFADESGERAPAHAEGFACGFYWTEGVRGLGWAVDAVPTLKGGSGLGIPSPPGIVMPDGAIVTPDLRDAERLQGFDADWTSPAWDVPQVRKGARWKLVGNAVSVPVAEWVGSRLQAPADVVVGMDEPLAPRARWPKAAWGGANGVFRVEASSWPVKRPYAHLADFLAYDGAPLSERATAGFLARTRTSTLNFPPGFIEVVERHLVTVARARVAA
jgi:DNA (cytosine-5)-methyltransferase 1